MNELSDRELKFGYWYSLHADAIRKIWLGILIFTVSIIWINFLWQGYAWLSTPAAVVSPNLQVDFKTYQAKHKPQSLTAGAVQIVKSGTSYNLAALVQNTNSEWAATSFHYSFIINGQSFEGNQFLLPGSQTWIAHYGLELSNEPKEATVEISAVQWKRIVDITKLPKPELQLEDQQVVFDSTRSTTARGMHLYATLVNSGVYSFTDVKVTALLTRGNVVRAIATQYITPVEIGSRKKLEFYWPDELPADKAEIIPEVNVLDPSFFKVR